MKYCNDKEKALIAIIAMIGIIVVLRVNSVMHGVIDDIIYGAKHRFLMKQCDECVEKMDKTHKQGTSTTGRTEDTTPKD